MAYRPRSMFAPGVPADVNRQLIAEIERYRHDPLGFVQFAFPWGQKGTPLERWSGPQMWQVDILIQLGIAMNHPDPNMRKIRIAIASGKGIGKSALLAMLFWWAMATAPMTRARVTAGTFDQLTATTWPEIIKWHSMLLCKHWFHVTATMVTARNEADSMNWRAEALAWNAQRPEAFAGLHNLGRRILFIMDEASQIEAPIWDTTDGIFTDIGTEIILIAPGNPTRGVGRFYEIFQPDNPEGARWVKRQIDSRTVAITDKNELNALVEQYGEDHDYVRAFVRGVFPRLSDMQFISTDAVRAAQLRDVAVTLADPLVMGVDVARSTAGDETVIAFRKGNDARMIPWVRMRTDDTMEIAAKVFDLYSRYGANALFVDSGGVGGGVYDRLLQLGVPALAVDAGKPDDRAGATTDPTRYANKRAAMWGAMKAWLASGGLPPENDMKGLSAQMIGPMYGYSARKGVDGIVLEAKKDMKKRGLPSPDMADALALTFAYRVGTPPSARLAGGPHRDIGHNGGPPMAASDYDPFA
jgi:hypothetical protein